MIPVEKQRQIVERMKKVADEKNMNQTELGDFLGVVRGTISKIFGGGNLTKQMAFHFADAFMLSREWIMDGVGDKWRDYPVLNSVEEDCLESFRGLSNERKQHVVRTLELLTAAQENSPVPTHYLIGDDSMPEIRIEHERKTTEARIKRDILSRKIKTEGRK